MRFLGVGLSLAGIGFVGRSVVVHWPTVRDALGGIAPLWCTAALGSGVAGMVIMAVAWRPVLGSLGEYRPYRQVVSMYFRGEVAKYVPGGVWSLVGRSELARRTGAEASVAYSSVVLSLALLWVASAALAGALLPFAMRAEWAIAALGLAALGVVAMHQRFLQMAVGMIGRLQRRSTLITVPSWGRCVRLLIAYLPAWLCVGTATWALARAVHADLGWGEVVWATTTSWLVGFLAVPVPGGIGVREAVFASALVTHPVALSATIALLARFLFTLIDTSGAVVFWATTVKGSDLRARDAVDSRREPPR